MISPIEELNEDLSAYVRSLCTAQPWDGNDYIGLYLVKCLGAKDTRIVRSISEKFIISAVRRALYKHGYEFEFALYLRGGGVDKPSFVRKLFGEECYLPWLSLPSTAENLDIAVRSYWAVLVNNEYPLNGMHKEEVYKFITSTTDDSHPLHHDEKSIVPKRTMVVVTNDKNEPLREEWRKSCFAPVSVYGIEGPDFEKDWLERNRLQLWAHAYHYLHDKNASTKFNQIEIDQFI